MLPNILRFNIIASKREKTIVNGTFPAIKNDAVIKTISSKEGFPQDENSAQALAVAKTYLEMPL
ncbi:MAG: sugar ABC transporter substrate-binding protein, partial [Treponema sp.]|nr:sugar ABC transporter substrate-binding protein [Treponema sp.]